MLTGSHLVWRDRSLLEQQHRYQSAVRLHPPSHHVVLGTGSRCPYPMAVISEIAGSTCAVVNRVRVLGERQYSQGPGRDPAGGLYGEGVRAQFAR